MPFNGTGTFTRVYNWVVDAAAAINITASRVDTDTQDIANGLSNCITRDGQGKPSAAIDWNGQNLTGVAAFSTTGNAVVTGNLGVGVTASTKFHVLSSGSATTTPTNISTLAGSMRLQGSLASACEDGISFQSGTAGGAAITFARDNSYGTGIKFYTNPTGTIVAGALSLVGAFDSNGAFYTSTGKIGPNATQQHTMPAVASDTYVLLAATQALSNKSFTGDIAGRGIALSKFKAATTSRSSTTTFADDPDLTVTLAAGTYAIDCFMPIWGTTSGAGGIKVSPAFTGTATSSSLSVSGSGNGAAWSNSTQTQSIAGTAFSSNTTTVSTGPVLADWMRLQGTVTVSVAGTFKIQWAQVASNANAANVGIGAWLNATQVS